MKYCSNCGNKMEDDMLFCQACGTKFVTVPVEEPKNDPPIEQAEANTTSSKKKQKESRFKANKTTKESSGVPKGMKFGKNICVVFAVLYVLLGLMIGEVGMAIGMGGLFAVLALMFWVLSKSPKDKPFIFGKDAGLKKTKFVLLCVVAAFVFVAVGGGMTGSTDAPDEKPQQSDVGNNKADSSANEEVKDDKTNEDADKNEPVSEPVVEEETPDIDLTTDFEKAVWKIAKDKGGKLVSIESIDVEGVEGTTVIASIVCENNETVVNDILAAIAEETKNNETEESSIINFGDIEKGDNGPVLVMAGVYGDGSIDITTTSLDYKSARNTWIKNQFSVWDGAHTAMEKLIIKNLNDEKSYKHIETNYRSIDDEADCDEINKLIKEAGYKNQVEIGDLFISTQFSAKNAFGGTVKNTAFGISSYNNNSITLIAIE